MFEVKKKPIYQNLGLALSLKLFQNKPKICQQALPSYSVFNTYKKIFDYTVAATPVWTKNSVCSKLTFFKMF